MRWKLSHPCVMQALLSQRHVTHTHNTYKSAPRLLMSCRAAPAQPNTAPQHAHQYLSGQVQSLLWLRSTMCGASPCTSGTAGLIFHLLVQYSLWVSGWMLVASLCPETQYLFSKGQAPIAYWTLSQPHYMSPGQCRVLLPAYHVKLAFFLQHAGEGHCGEDASSQRAVGINGSPVLGIPVLRNCRVKTGPVHP